MEIPLNTIPARSGAAAIVLKDQKIKIINTHDSQVIDTWAFHLPPFQTGDAENAATLFPRGDSTEARNSYSEAANRAANAVEYMSMSHFRSCLNKLVPEVGDVLVSQKRAPLLKLVEDTSPGVHDTLVSACDRWRYAQLGAKDYHGSCTDNLWDAIEALSNSLKQRSGAGTDADGM
jgi:uncharacterized protein YcgI (DUF1989 family)